MIRKATPADLPALYDLRTEAEIWLAKAGIDQWVPKNKTLGRNLIQERVQAGVTWVNAVNDEIIWTLAIDKPDLTFWKPEDDLNSALYIYKFIVSRRHKGSGSAALDWVTEKAKIDSKQWLRVDFRRTNTALATYYECQGFHHVRTVRVPNHRSGMLYQKPVSSVSPFPASPATAPSLLTY